MIDTPTLMDDVCRVRQALDTVAEALVGGDGDTLLECETELAKALASLTSQAPTRPLAPEVSLALREEATRCRASLAHCRRLGESLEHLVRHTLAIEGRSGAYTRAGQAAIVPPSGTLQTRG